MIQYAEANYGVNPHRIYITGLSAGAGMTSDMLADGPWPRVAIWQAAPTRP